MLGVSAANPAGHEKQLRASEVAAERGGRVVALTLPHSTKIRLSFLSGFVLDGLPGWRETMHLPVPERLRALADPEVRRRLNEGAHSDEAGILRGLANWERLIIVESFARENDDATGRTVGEVAAARGGEPFDTLLDIVIADELRTGLSPRPFGDDEADWKMRARGVAQPGCGDRRLGRRGPSGHDVRRDLHDVAARPRRARAPGGDARGGGPADHRRAGAAVRAEGTRPHPPKAGTPTW